MHCAIVNSYDKWLISCDTKNVLAITAVFHCSSPAVVSLQSPCTQVSVLMSGSHEAEQADFTDQDYYSVFVLLYKPYSIQVHDN